MGDKNGKNKSNNPNIQPMLYHVEPYPNSVESLVENKGCQNDQKDTNRYRCKKIR